jgi:lysophospholipase L1-like esterase
MRVLVFGASTAQGYWDSLGGWADRLKKHYDQLQMQNFSIEQPRVMNLGVSGDTTAEVLKRLESESKSRQNDKGLAIIIQVGSNNAAEQNDLTVSTAKEYQKELENIIEMAQKFTDKIIIIGFPAVDESKTNPIEWADLYFKNRNIVMFENAAQETTKEADIPFIAIHQEFSKRIEAGEVLQAHDGLHPNNKGHELIFQLVRPVLDEVLSEGRGSHS